MTHFVVHLRMTHFVVHLFVSFDLVVVVVVVVMKIEVIQLSADSLAASVYLCILC